MTNNKFSTRIIALSAALAAISAVTQLVHIGYRSPQWGMWIDVVAVTWIIAFFLYGFKSSFAVSAVGALVITLFAPDTWLGASMKWVATFPMYLALFIIMKTARNNLDLYRKPVNLIIPVILGLMIRCLVVLPLNYYYAIPIWTGMTSLQAIKAIPWYIIAGFNIVQGILDVILAWIIVFKFKLTRFNQRSD
jgi:riboflavin transporter